jgi:hypothetical protein
MRRFKHHQDLPYKVWEHITTFLSSEETKRLLCVNRTLFAIAMNERYRTSTIETMSCRDTHRNLVRLWYVTIGYFDHVVLQYFLEVHANLGSL